MVNKFFFIQGGSERYYFELKKLLEHHGHEVVPFAMQHPRNFDTPYETDFVKNIEFNDLSPLEKLKHAPDIISRVIYSRQAREAVARLIERVKPDLAHIHMIDHQLSPSILHAFREHGIPVIQTCHQYKLVCPSYLFFIAHKNQICERCIQGNFYNAVFQKCHKNSLAASALVAAESYIHRFAKIYDIIDIFHAPSRFLGEKLAQGGYPREKIRHCFYTINLENYPYHPDASNYFIYYGRLSEEKGLMTLLKAMGQAPETNLYLVGDGPQRPALEAFAKEKRLQHVRFWGRQEGKALVSLVQQAQFVVMPSECYDNSPLVIYESFSMGKPVVASTLGGMPELVDNGENGLHFKPGDADELAEKIKLLWHDRRLCAKMGRAARDKALAEFSPEVHYKRMMLFYEEILLKKTPVETMVDFQTGG